MSAAPSIPAFNTPIDDIEVVKTVITPAQFLLMDASAGTNVIVVPSPGIGKANIMTEVECNLQFPPSGGIAYTTGTGTFNIGYVFGFQVALMASSDIKIGRSFYTRVGAGAQIAILYPNDIDARNGQGLQNADIFVNVTTATKYLAGNYPFLLTIRYRTITLL
jgi:hypothetical protein